MPHFITSTPTAAPVRSAVRIPHPWASTLVLGAALLLPAAPASAQASAPASPAPTAQKGGAAAPAAKPALTVNVATPQPFQWTQALPVNGTLAAWQEAVIGSQVSGLRLVDLPVQVGDRVSAGQVLARFDEQPVLHDLAQARAALLEAQANQLEAAANAERARAVKGSGALSAQQEGQFQAAEAIAQARVATAQAAVAAQELRLQHTRVVAPDAGVVSARMATLGAVAGAGQELFRLIRQSRLEWRAEVPAADLARVKPGTAARLTTSAGMVVQGTVRAVAPSIDPQTRNGLAYVDIKPAEGSDARAGMFVRGELRFDTRRGLSVPASSVLLRDGFDVVLVVDAQSRVRQTKVKVLAREGDLVAIEGLDARARIVVRGGAFLADGDAVRVVEASPR